MGHRPEIGRLYPGWRVCSGRVKREGSRGFRRCSGALWWQHKGITDQGVLGVPEFSDHICTQDARTHTRKQNKPNKASAKSLGHRSELLHPFSCWVDKSSLEMDPSAPRHPQSTKHLGLSGTTQLRSTPNTPFLRSRAFLKILQNPHIKGKIFITQPGSP